MSVSRAHTFPGMYSFLECLLSVTLGFSCPYFLLSRPVLSGQIAGGCSSSYPIGPSGLRSVICMFCVVVVLIRSVWTHAVVCFT